MAFARPIADANGEWIRQRYTELSDVIRARNKREDRLLNVRLKFYEREKNIRLNIIRKEQYQIERVRTSLFEDANRIQMRKQNSAVPLWMSPRPETQPCAPEMIFSDWEIQSNFIQTERPFSKPPIKTLSKVDILRCYSAR